METGVHCDENVKLLDFRLLKILIFEGNGLHTCTTFVFKLSASRWLSTQFSHFVLILRFEQAETAVTSVVT